jgi:hypothetical protein
MERPQSIINFERCYLGAMAVGILSSVLNWSAIQGQVAATPGAGLLPDWFMPVTIVISLGINLLLWYFAARRGAVVAKWIIVVFFAFSLIGIPGMLSGLVPTRIMIFGLVSLVLNAIAVWMLFRPDSKPWFKGVRPDLKDTFQ